MGYTYIHKKLSDAARISRAKQDDRNYFLGAVGIRSDGATVISYNGAPKFPTPEHHCEYRLCRKLDQGSRVYLARTLASGEWANSRPCPRCFQCLKAKGCLYVAYTIGPDEYGIIEF